MWLKDIYGLTYLGKFAGAFDSLFLGAGDAGYYIMDNIYGAVDGVSYMVDHPQKTTEGMIFLYKACHPLQYPKESQILAQIILQVTQNCINDFSEADYNKKCRIIGRLVGEIIVAFISAKGADKAIEVRKDSK